MTLVVVVAALALTGGLVFFLTRSAPGARNAGRAPQPPPADTTKKAPAPSPRAHESGRLDAASIVSFRSLATATVAGIERCAARRGDGLLTGPGGADCVAPSTLRKADPSLARADLRVGSAKTRRIPPRATGSVWIFPIIDRSPGTPTSGLVGGYSVVVGAPTGPPGTRAPAAWFAHVRLPNGRTARTCAIGGGLRSSGTLDGRGRTHPEACPAGRW